MNIANPMTVSNTTYTATATSASTTLNTAMHEFPVDTLQIGTWKRMMLQERDIQCHYDTVQHLMIWSIQDGLHAFKMQFSLDTIQSISMDLCPERPGIGRLRICLQSSDDNGISFYMFNNGAWTQCRDFTQDKQATQVHVHELFGPAMPLWSQWQVLAASVKGLNAKLSYLDPWYKNVAMYNGNVATSTTSSAPPTSHAQFVLSWNRCACVTRKTGFLFYTPLRTDKNFLHMIHSTMRNVSACAPAHSRTSIYIHMYPLFLSTSLPRPPLSSLLPLRRSIPYLEKKQTELVLYVQTKLNFAHRELFKRLLNVCTD